ncbi:MAG: hypothetical protein RIR73_1833 [Chloroflexota bacterium]|jgi:hypothetical protein
MKNLARSIRSAFVSLSIAVFLVACATGNAPVPPALPTVIAPSEGLPGNLPPAGSCENDLLPVTQGATWSYYSAGGPNGDFFYTDTITETTSAGFTLASQFPTLTLNQKWLCAEGGLLALQLGGGTTASVSMQNMIADFKTKEVSGVNLPRAIAPGLQWDYTLVIEDPAANPPGTFHITMQHMGSETINVPAGVFETVKLQATFDAQINVEFQGSFFLYTVNGSSIHWYAPGVGLIKSIENIEFSGTPFTSTTELQSYSIP